MPPVPALDRLVLVLTALALFGSSFSSPKKFGTPNLLAEVRAALVAFEVLALSSILISTVRMSPTRLARWSSKKARAPVRHSELGEAGCCPGSRAEAAIE